MNVTITPKKETSEVALAITLPREDFTLYVKRAAKKLSTDHPLPGFRPGTAPLEVVISSFGQQRLLHEATDEALPSVLARAFVEHDIEALGRPAVTIENVGIDQEFRFTATVAVVPKLRLGNVSQVTATRRIVETSDAEVEKELKYLAKMRSTFLEVPKPAETGETVIVDFQVKTDGVPLPGSESKNHPVHLGEGHFIPEFEQKLIGITAGESREFPIRFPDTFADEQHRGKEAAVTVTAHSVRKRIIPEVNDAFARSLGKFASLQQLKDELKQNITKEKQRHEEERLKGELTQRLAQASEFDPLPELLIEREIDRHLEELQQVLAYQHKTLEQYLSEKKQTTADARQELRAPAIDSIKTALVVRELAKQERIEIPESEVEEKATEYLRRFKTVSAATDQLDVDQLKENIAGNLRNQKTLQRLLELATIADEPPKSGV